MPSAPPQGQTVGLETIPLNLGLTTPEDSVSKTRIYLFASDHGVGAAVWTWEVAIRRIGNGDMAGISSVNKVASPSAATWTASLVFEMGVINVYATGIAGVTIDWLATSDDAFSMTGPFI